MKVIAAMTGSTFLVEMREDEIVKAAGFRSSYDDGWMKLNKGQSVKVGTVINVEAAYNFHHRIVSFQKEAGSAANTLRALAELIGGALPDVVIPPVDPDFAEVAE